MIGRDILTEDALAVRGVELEPFRVHSSIMGGVSFFCGACQGNTLFLEGLILLFLLVVKDVLRLKKKRGGNFLSSSSTTVGTDVYSSNLSVWVVPNKMRKEVSTFAKL